MSKSHMKNLVFSAISFGVAIYITYRTYIKYYNPDDLSLVTLLAVIVIANIVMGIINLNIYLNKISTSKQQ